MLSVCYISDAVLILAGNSTNDQESFCRREATKKAKQESIQEMIDTFKYDDQCCHLDRIWKDVGDEPSSMHLGDYLDGVI